MFSKKKMANVAKAPTKLKAVQFAPKELPNASYGLKVKHCRK